MRPSVKEFKQFYTDKVQFVVPVYQRPYSWDLDRWSNLWRDLAYVYLDKATSPKTGPTTKKHFMGTLITEPEGMSGAGDVSVFRIVDGQQRLVTVYVLLAAIRDIDHFTKNRAVNQVNGLSHIIDPDDPDAPSPPSRFCVQMADQDILQRIASGRAIARGVVPHSHRLAQAYEFFLYQLWRGVPSLEAALLSANPKEQLLPPKQPRGGFQENTIFGFWSSVVDRSNAQEVDLVELRSIVNQSLQVLELLVETADEDSALIFESVNSKSQSLHQFDHIKNSVFVRLRQHRDQVFASDWEPIVSRLKTVSYQGKRSDAGDQFIYDYLIARGEAKRQGTINKGRAYSQFMSRLDSQVPGPITRQKYEADFLKFLREDLLIAAAIWPVAVGQSSTLRLQGVETQISKDCARTIRTIMELSAGPPVPLVLHLLEGRATGKLDETELDTGLKYVESFVARHGLYGTALSPFRSLFMQVMAALDRSYSIESLRLELLNRGWPTDDDVIGSATKVDLYGRLQSRQVNALLRGLEEQLAGPGAHEMVFGKAENEYTVEHVLPKSEPNAEWRAAFKQWHLSAANQKRTEERRHRLGNLSAVSGKDNKRLGTKSFAKKRQLLMEAVAPLRLHEFIKSQERWTFKEIDERGVALARVATQRWSRPISGELLQANLFD